MKGKKSLADIVISCLPQPVRPACVPRLQGSRIHGPGGTLSDPRSFAACEGQTAFNQASANCGPAPISTLPSRTGDHISRSGALVERRGNSRPNDHSQNRDSWRGDRLSKNDDGAGPWFVFSFSFVRRIATRHRVACDGERLRKCSIIGALSDGRQERQRECIAALCRDRQALLARARRCAAARGDREAPVRSSGPFIGPLASSSTQVTSARE